MARYPGFYGSGQLFTFKEIYRLCMRSYENLDPGMVLDEDGAKWKVENAWEEGNFAAYIIKKDQAWNAIVFRGTDGRGDWLRDNIPNALGAAHPPQYKRGREIVAAHGHGRVLVGHSLGGGIATYASAHHGIAAATIFPAPVIPSKLPQNGNCQESCSIFVFIQFDLDRSPRTGSGFSVTILGRAQFRVDPVHRSGCLTRAAV